jgi:hypothetical protein
MNPLLEEMQARLREWFEHAVERCTSEGEHASITFELRGDSAGYMPDDRPIREVAVREEFFVDHLAGATEAPL